MKIKVIEQNQTHDFTVDKHEFAIISSDILTEARWILFPLTDSEKEKHPEHKGLHTAIKRYEIKTIEISL